MLDHRYPLFLVTAVTKPGRTQAIVLLPTHRGLSDVVEETAKRLHDFVFPSKAYVGTAEQVLRATSSSSTAKLLSSVRLQAVRLARSLREVEVGEVGHRWVFPSDPLLHPTASGWPLIKPDLSVSIRNVEQPPVFLEVSVVGEVGTWGWYGFDQQHRRK